MRKPNPPRRRHRRGRHGQRHRRAPRERGRRGPAPRHRPARTSSDAEKKDRAARNRFAAGGLDKAAQGAPGRVLPQGPRAPRLGRQHRGRPREARRRATSSIEAIIEQIEPKRALFEKLEKVVPRALHRRVEHERPAHRRHDARAARRPSGKRFLVMHFFNPVRYMKLLELVAGPDTSPETLDARPPLRRGRARQGHRRRQGHAELRRQPHRRARDDGDHPPDARGRPRARGRRRHHRRADGPPEERELPHRPTSSASTPSSTSPTTATRRSPSDEDREVFEVPAYIRAMVEKKLLGDKTKGGFYKQGQGRRGSRRSTRRRSSTAPRAATRRSSSAMQGAREDRGPDGAPAQARRRPGQGRAASRGRCSRGRSRTRRAASARSPTTSSAIDDAMKWGYNWELGPFETWDALGFEAVVDRMKKDGIALPASIDKMRAAGAKSFYTDDGRVFDLSQGEYVEARGRPAHRDAHRPPQGRRARAQERRRRGVGPGRRRARAHLQDEGEQHRPRRHQDASTTRWRRRRRDFRALVDRQPGRALLRRREPVPRRHGGGAEAVGPDPRRWCRASRAPASG